ncbi:hypothetical protein Cus16_2525 [Curtobacterium sp. ER1/6]|nr:hypothetical protein Cus16_2525 [Curtobacterium sp. ER1/6]
MLLRDDIGGPCWSDIDATAAYGSRRRRVPTAARAGASCRRPTSTARRGSAGAARSARRRCRRPAARRCRVQGVRDRHHEGVPGGEGRVGQGCERDRVLLALDPRRGGAAVDDAAERAGVHRPGLGQWGTATAHPADRGEWSA